MCLKALALYFLIQKSIELVRMDDPSVQSFRRPMYESEPDELGELNLHEQRFDMGIYFQKGVRVTGDLLDVPLSVGRVMQKLNTTGITKIDEGKIELPIEKGC